MGPVTPLLAVLRQIRKRRPDIQFVWAGTPTGPERQVVEKDGIHFYTIPPAKLARYPSWSWVTWPIAYWKARKIADEVLEKVAPSLVVSIGGFTAVPLMKQAAKQHIPCAIHQLDLRVGLSNSVLAPLCQSVTTSFEYSKLPFRGVQSERIPTPCRYAGRQMPDRHAAVEFFGLDPSHPVVFVTGGGTGALAINQAMKEILDLELKVTQIIHLTGLGKKHLQNGELLLSKSGYVVSEFFTEEEMLMAYAAADVVVSRAGMGAISELACLSKPSIFVPIPKSHQEDNAKRLSVPVVHQAGHFSKKLRATILEFIRNVDEREKLGQRLHQALPTDDGSALAERWLKLIR